MVRRRTASVVSDAPEAEAPAAAPASSSVPAMKTITSRAVAKRPAAPVRAASAVRAKASRIPSPLRFPLVVFLSLSVSSALHTFVKEVTAGDLASVSKRVEDWTEVGGLITWRGVELGLAWALGYDSYDVAALTVLTHLPTLVFLYAFYTIHPTTVILSGLAVLASSVIPFHLLRRPIPLHSPSTAPSGTVANRYILLDKSTMAATTLLATSIYSVVLYLGYATFLPVHLVTYFDNIRDISSTHLGAAGLPVLTASILPAGYAAWEFLFVGSTGVVPISSASTSKTEAKYQFDPASASLWQHIYHNAWGWYSAREKALIKRTFVAAGLVGANTAVQLFGTVGGVELPGAAGVAGVWSAATVLVGAAYWWVGSVDGL